MATKKKSLLAAAGNAGELQAIEDVFSTYLYTGTGTTNVITNGIDLAGEGGLVWLKARSLAQGHTVTDTERGSNFVLQPNTTDAQVNTGSLYVSSFNSDGFSIGTGSNTFSQTFASWTFRKAPRFFDVVTYTGDGTTDGSKKISHNLGATPGCIIVKRTDATGNWNVYHRETASSPETRAVYLNLANAYATGGVWGSTLPTDAEFTVGSASTTNVSGANYVAYLFAHDPLGPSGDGSDGLIACGSYTGDGTTNGTKEINLGWEPQTLIIKRTNAADDWIMTDVMMGIPTSPNGTYDRHILKPNTSDAEYASADYFNVTSTGFRLTSNNSQVNASGSTYIYIAIRRGPMRQPESGTEVFDAGYGQGTKPWFQNDGWPVDMLMQRNRNSGSNTGISSRLTQERYMFTNLTNAEATGTNYDFDYMNGAYNLAFASTDYIGWMFRRAPGFFDVVAYTGDGVAGRTVSHNLGVAPEMMWIKRRDVADDWSVYYGDNTDYLYLNSSQASVDNSFFWNDTSPTDSAFTVGTNGGVNASASTYIAYLFATLPGVSKVGSYTGNGTSQTIDCGFTSGARFILIKRTDSTGDWYVWDTERGIVAANDPHLSLNTTAAEVTTDDSVDPDNSGFIVNQVAATNINVSSASYIFYSVA